MKTAPPNAPRTRSELRGETRSTAASATLGLLRCGLPVLTVLALGGCAGFATGGSRADAGPVAVAQADAPATVNGAASSARRPAAAPVPDVSPGDLPDIELTPQIIFQLLASEVAAQRGEIASATATYLALARQTHDPRLARRATELALAERSLERALRAAQMWREFAPDSKLAAQTLEALWLSTGRLDSVEPLLAQRLAAARAANRLAQAYPELLRSLMRAPDHRAALALFDRLAAPDQAVPEARLAAAALAERASDKERAAAEATEALRLAPDDERMAIAAARQLQQSAGGMSSATTLLGEFLHRRQDATEARFAYARLLAAQGNAKEARKQMERALSQEPENQTILYSLAQIAYQANQLGPAEEYLRRYLALAESIPRDRNPAWLFLSQIEEDRGNDAQAIEWLSKVTPGEQYLGAQIRRAILTGRVGRVEEARALLRGTGATDARERVQLVAAEAQLLREARRYVEAFDVIDQALRDTPDSTELLYDHAMAAERIDRLDVLEKSLRRLIELRPDSAHAYNALGYTFADRKLRLDEAQSLIEKALQISPDDPHIVDSLGWVLYRRGKIDEALVQLRRAWSLRPDAEIGVHLGEVLWTAGSTDEARKIWRETRALEPDNEALRRTLAKFDVTL